jgi:hypothetical protein
MMDVRYESAGVMEGNKWVSVEREAGRGWGHGAGPYHSLFFMLLSLSFGAPGSSLRSFGGFRSSGSLERTSSLDHIPPRLASLRS